MSDEVAVTGSDVANTGTDIAIDDVIDAEIVDEGSAEADDIIDAQIMSGDYHIESAVSAGLPPTEDGVRPSGGSSGGTDYSGGGRAGGSRGRGGTATAIRKGFGAILPGWFSGWFANWKFSLIEIRANSTKHQGVMIGGSGRRPQSKRRKY